MAKLTTTDRFAHDRTVTVLATRCHGHVFVVMWRPQWEHMVQRALSRWVLDDDLPFTLADGCEMAKAFVELRKS